jgi:hypothetical protein
MHICAFDLDLEKKGNGDICKSTPSSHKKFKRFLTESARKENSKEFLSRYDKTRITIRHQHDR